MGSIFEYNWVLKLSDIDSKDLLLGKEYSFEKKGMRVYPINIPIDLVNSKWEAIASCMISKISISSEQTTGIYTIIEIYNEHKKSIMSEQWQKYAQQSQ